MSRKLIVGNRVYLETGSQKTLLGNFVFSETAGGGGPATLDLSSNVVSSVVTIGTSGITVISPATDLNNETVISAVSLGSSTFTKTLDLSSTPIVSAASIQTSNLTHTLDLSSNSLVAATLLQDSQLTSAGTLNLSSVNLTAATTITDNTLTVLTLSDYGKAIYALSPVSFWQVAETEGTVSVDVMEFQNGTYVGDPILAVPSLVPDDVLTTKQTVLNLSSNYVEGGDAANSGTLVTLTPDGCIQAEYHVATEELYTDSNANSDTSSKIVAKSAPITLGEWTEFTAIFNDQSASVNVEGVGKVTVTSSQSRNYATDANDAISVGVNKQIGSVGVEPFNGLIDELKVFGNYIPRLADLFFISDSFVYDIVANATGYAAAINALAPVAYWRLGESSTAVSMTPPFTEDFTQPDGNFNSELWISNNPSVVSIQSNRLKVQGDPANNPLVESAFNVSGDFDIQIDYDSSETYESSGVGYIGLYCTVGTKYFQIIHYVQNVTHNYSLYSNVVGHEFSLQTGGVNLPVGKLRINRTGTALTIYYHDGNDWVVATSQTMSTDVIDNIGLSVGEWSSDPAVTVYWDNLVITADAMERTSFIAKDEIGTYDGTYTGSPTLSATGLVAGDSDTAMELDGAASFKGLETSAYIPVTTALTITAIIKPDTVSGFKVIVDTGHSGAGILPSYSLHLIDNKIRIVLYVSNSTTGRLIESSTESLIALATYHIAIVYNGSTAKIYIDGQEDSSFSWSSTIWTNTYDKTFVGSRESTISSFGTFDGIVDEVAIFDTALTAQNVTDLYDAYKPTYETQVNSLSPVAYWRLGEASGTTANDETTNHDLTYVGSPTLGTTGLLVGNSDTAVEFDAAGEYAERIEADFRSSDSSGSIVAIINTSNTASNNVILNSSSSGAASLIQFYTSSAGNKLRFYVDTGPVVYYVTGTANVCDGSPHHVAVVSDGLTWKFYVDGVEDTISAVTQGNIGHWFADIPNRVEILLGTNNARSASFTGILDEVTIFDSALTAQEIADLYTATGL